MRKRSNDQQVVDNSYITVTQLDATTFNIAIADLEDNVPGMATITVSVTDGHFTFNGTFNATTQGATPVITWDGLALNSSPGTSYQWFLDGAFIPDAMEQTYAPTENGDYTVLVVDANGCSNTSESYFFGSTGIAALSGESVVICPQSATGHFFVKGAAAGTAYRLVDARGRVVAAGVMQQSPQMIGTASLAPGMHVLLLIGETGTVRLLVMVEQGWSICCSRTSLDARAKGGSSHTHVRPGISQLQVCDEVVELLQTRILRIDPFDLRLSCGRSKILQTVSPGILVVHDVQGFDTTFKFGIEPDDQFSNGSESEEPVRIPLGAYVMNQLGHFSPTMPRIELLEIRPFERRYPEGSSSGGRELHALTPSSPSPPGIPG